MCQTEIETIYPLWDTTEIARRSNWDSFDAPTERAWSSIMLGSYESETESHRVDQRNLFQKIKKLTNAG